MKGLLLHQKVRSAVLAEEALARKAPFRHASPSPLARGAYAVLGLPLFYKVLVANCVVVVLGAGLGTWFTLTHVSGPDGRVNWGAVAIMLIGGFCGSLLINAVVLKLALRPLQAIEQTVDRIANGDLAARAPHVLFEDREVHRLGDTLNEMMDVLQQHRAELQKMSGQVLAAQEDERKRIARELHDETAQSLTTLLIRLKMLDRARDSEELHQQIHDLRQLIVETLEAVRSLAVELRPSTLDDLGLVAALEAYVESYSARITVPVRFETQGFLEGERLAHQVELVLYRVVQEALTNVAKHANATSVSVRLVRLEDEVVAYIQDNGRGFDVSATMRSRETGLGLFGMQERMALVQGSLTIDSAPGRGTRVEARVPLWSGRARGGTA